MADTRQIVSWALEQTCALRGQIEARSPHKALTAVARARAYSHSLRNKTVGSGVFGDVYVSSYSYGWRPAALKKQPFSPSHVDGHPPQLREKRTYPPYPAGGFLISEAFASLGGPSDLFAMCGICKANPPPSGIAGCCGTLSQWPDSHETEEQIRGIILRLGIQRQFDEAFPKATPLWYGLWALSRVPPRSLGMLRTIISSMREEDARAMQTTHKTDKRQLRDFAHLAKATETAEQHNLP